MGSTYKDVLIEEVTEEIIKGCYHNIKMENNGTCKMSIENLVVLVINIMEKYNDKIESMNQGDD